MRRLAPISPTRINQRERHSPALGQEGHLGLSLGRAQRVVLAAVRGQGHRVGHARRRRAVAVILVAVGHGVVQQGVGVVCEHRSVSR